MNTTLLGTSALINVVMHDDECAHCSWHVDDIIADPVWHLWHCLGLDATRPTEMGTHIVSTDRRSRKPPENETPEDTANRLVQDDPHHVILNIKTIRAQHNALSLIEARDLIYAAYRRVGISYGSLSVRGR